jgi:A/G-specific adenine glycosylase
MSRTSKAAGTHKAAPKRGNKSKEDAAALGFSVLTFRRRLSRWYREHARELPWRGVGDPYATWLSEIMLQQTRVAAVIDRYRGFLLRFPTIGDLAKANEAEVLALWSGLGYYGRARMLLRGAQFVEREMQGRLPQSAAELRKLPGVGEYTAAAIASIAFGESVAVLDGNVERVLLRLLGEPEEKSARARARLVEIAQMLMPAARSGRAAKSVPGGDRGEPSEDHGNRPGYQGNPPGDHNQAMMELGATICLPRAPLCLQCPVVELCKTRGEHATGTRTKMQSRTVSHLLALRKRGVATEVLLERRARAASLMAGMMELPGLPLDATEGREPALRLRHSITNTNYYVQVFTESVASEDGMAKPVAEHSLEHSLLEQIPAAKADLEWVPTSKLAQQPLTGLARKTLQRLQVMTLPALFKTGPER